MQAGSVGSYMDVAQLTLYAFWLFFAGLIFYLRREDKREGYPLQSDRSDHVLVQGFPAIPSPKTYLLHDGSTRMMPREEPPAGPLAAVPTASWPGAPLTPTGNPLIDGVGPAAWVNRADVPDAMPESDQPKIVPLRVATDHWIDANDPDPRGMPVIAADGATVGKIADVWLDKCEMLVRYLEAELPVANGTRRALIPMPLARVTGGEVKIATLMAQHFADVPMLRNPDQVTLREEDRISAYFGGGQLYATPERQEPFL